MGTISVILDEAVSVVVLHRAMYSSVISQRKIESAWAERKRNCSAEMRNVLISLLSFRSIIEELHSTGRLHPDYRTTKGKFMHAAAVYRADLLERLSPNKM